LIEKLKREGDFIEYTFSGLRRLMHDGRGKYHTFNNKDYPEIKITTLEEFLKANPDYQLK